VATELRARARTYLEELDRKNEEKRRELGVADDLAGLAGLSPTMLVALGEKGVKTLDDLADLASDELIEMLGELAPGAAEADAIIMAARAHWFADEAPAADATGESPGETPASDAAAANQAPEV